MKKEYVAIDQYGNTKFLGKYPRKELMEYWGTSHANKIYRDLESGESVHIGWVIKEHWYEVMKISPMN